MKAKGDLSETPVQLRTRRLIFRAFRSAEVQKSAWNFSHGLNLNLVTGMVGYLQSSNFILAEAIWFYDQNSGRISEAICKISTRNVEKHLNRGYWHFSTFPSEFCRRHQNSNFLQNSSRIPTGGISVAKRLKADNFLKSNNHFFISFNWAVHHMFSRIKNFLNILSNQIVFTKKSTTNM